jgi:Xaa-Pro aminopeptidase
MTSTRWGRVPWTPQDRRPWRDLPFPDEEYQDRISRLQAVLATLGHAGIIVRNQGVNFADTAYLSGFVNPLMGEVYVVVPTVGAPAMVTDSFVHGEPMHMEIYQVWFDDVRCTLSGRAEELFGTIDSSLADLLVDVVRESGATAESWALAGQVPGEITDHLRAALPAITLQPEELIMPTLRAVKSPREVAVMAEAAAIADLAMEAALSEVRVGANERTVAAALIEAMIGAGADGPLYFIQVASGPRAGFRNVRPVDRTINAGDALYIGFGLRYRGYCSRLANGFSVGPPTDRMERLMRANRAIVEDAVALIRPGASTADVAQAATDRAEAEGIADVTWVGGHGIGLHTHDAPLVGTASAHRFEPGNTFIFEPMVIETGLMTANAERVFTITEDGCRSLSRLPFDLWERLA